MAYCPNCAVEVPADAKTCAKCDAIFGQGWDPLPAPAVPEPPSVFGRLMVVLATLAAVAISGAFLFIGAVSAYSEHRANAWFVACVALGVAVVAIAVLARLRWSLLAMLIAVPFGFVSCAANFKWHGG